MSGRQQHYIPQHFQRAFADADSNRKQIWLFRRGNDKGVKTSIRKVAQARDFYERPNETNIPTLDDLITDYETRLTALVNKIRDLAITETIPASDIAEITSHLSIRAAYIREFVAEGAQSIFNLISSILENPEIILSGINIPMHIPPKYITDTLTEKMEQRGFFSITNVSKEAIVKLYYFALREEYSMLRDQALESFSMFMDSFPFQIRGIGRVAHTRVLQDSIAPEKRRDQLATLKWTIERHESGDAILPDCVVIAKDKNGWGPYILSERDTLECVILPIAPDRLAVGRADDAPLSVPVDYNNHAVESCFSFFLAPTSNEELEGAITVLGGEVRGRVTRLTEEAGQTAVAKALHVDGDRPNGDMENITWDLCMQAQTFSYSVRLHDFGDKELANKVAQTINELVIDFCRDFPARTLDGITFAVDYAAAIRDLDRGLEQSFEVKPADYGEGVGVAMPLLVRRGDQIKTHVVVRADIAMSLIGDDNAAMREADAVVLYGLASAALSDLIDTKFPGVQLAPHPETYDGWLSNYTDGVYSVYFTNRVVPTGYGHIKFYQRIAQDTLEALVSEAVEANEKYKKDSDYETYFIRCASAASNLMNALARLFGAKCAFFGPHSEDQILHDRLGTFELRKWASLFAADLERFHNRLEDWNDHSEIYFLNRHLERLLFETGVLPDQLETGELYIHASHEARMIELNRAYRQALQ